MLGIATEQHTTRQHVTKQHGQSSTHQNRTATEQHNVKIACDETAHRRNNTVQCSRSPKQHRDETARKQLVKNIFKGPIRRPRFFFSFNNDNQKFVSFRVAYYFAIYYDCSTGVSNAHHTGNTARPCIIVKCPLILNPSSDKWFRNRELAPHIRVPSYAVPTPSITDPSLGSGEQKVAEDRF